MGDSQCLGVGKRWETSIDRKTKQKDDILEKEKQQFQEQVHKDARRALPVDTNISRSLQTSQTSQIETSLHRNDAGNLGKQCSERVMTDIGQSASLPMPPHSPTASKTTLLHLDGLDQCSIDTCRSKANELQATINSLQSQLGEKEKECQRLREERRQASRLHRDSIHKDDEEEIEKLKKRIQRLDEMIEKDDETIECLQKELLETRAGKRQLEMQLAEAESTVQDRGRLLKEMQNATNASGVACEQGSTPQTAQVPERTPKESGLHGKNWVIHCQKGHRKSGFSIARDVIGSKSSRRKP
ncbi:MAG: hypothetical protein Q9201_006309 [Fulgogasparrea decipioides]